MGLLATRKAAIKLGSSNLGPAVERGLTKILCFCLPGVSMGLQLLTIFTLLSLVSASGALAQSASPAGKETFWFIPHAHGEGAVFKTREEFLEMGLPNIL